jgi:capsular polysaccharide biosynthesis protein
MSEVILKMVKNVPDKRGRFSHYGHFIHDFIVPLIHHIENSETKYTHIFLNDYTKWTSLGNFRVMAEKILGVKITQLPQEDIDKLEYPKLIISTLSFGPYRPILFKNIISHVSNTLTLTESTYKVILIERGKLKEGSGAHRRFLPNHKKLEKKLSNYFGPIFKNIILESISIDEQVSLFKNAEIVIGQHGAGLCNIVWMNKPNSLVIEFPPHEVETFKNMCKAKQFKYSRLPPSADRVIDVCKKRMKHITDTIIVNDDSPNITDIIPSILV